MTSKSVSWHQIVCHVIKNFHSVKAFTMTSNMLDTLCLLWCHTFVMMSYTRHDLKKSVCPDFKMFVMMSKYLMRTKGSSLLQKVRHYFKMFVMTSTRRHRVSTCVITSKCLSWNQKYVMMSKRLSWLIRSYIQI